MKEADRRVGHLLALHRLALAFSFREFGCPGQVWNPKLITDELAGGTASKSSLKSVLEKDPAPLKDGP